MQLSLFGGTANPGLTASVSSSLGVEPGGAAIRRFPDGEIHVEILQSVRGRGVFLIQPTGPPVADNLVELLLMADACRRAGAAHVTAVMPYFGYARQDRRAKGREPVSARVVADAVSSAGVRRVVAVDLHNPALEGFFNMPLEHLSAVPLLAEAVRPHMGEDPVVVSPDLGAVKLAERYARLLGAPTAVVHKSRLTGDTVRAGRVMGEVRRRSVIIVDDMISTGATVEAAANAVRAEGCCPDISVVATHGLLVSQAGERLKSAGISRLFVTDSIAGKPAFSPTATVSLAPLLSGVINRLHAETSLAGLLSPG